MKFIYNSKQKVDSVILDEVPGVDEVKLFGNKVEVFMSDEYISDFFRKPINKLKAEDVIDYAEGGLTDFLQDAFLDNKLNIDVKDLTFDNIEV